MFLPTVSDRDWSSYTCVIPAVSIGNVGQLSVDLLLSTLEVSRVGYFYSDITLPLVGNNPFPKSYLAQNECELVTGFEAYENKSNKLIIVQIRGTIPTNKRTKFRCEIIKWLKEEKFTKVILLSSTAAHERIDSQLIGPPCRYLSTPELDKLISLEESFKWQKLEPRKTLPTVPLIDESSSLTPHLYIPGGGITKLFFEDSCKENIPLAVLLIFCSEGDNIPDALALTSYLNQWLNLLQDTSISKWIIPASWQCMFGNRPPIHMF